MRLVQPPGRIAGGSIRFKDRDLLTLSEPDMRQVRGAEIALIFQEPMTALNPVFTIGDQIAETLVVHGRASRREAIDQAAELLDAVRIPDARIARQGLPASAVGRDAAARADRDGAGVPPLARHRGRTDDGARCDHPGADSRPAARDEGRVQPVAAAHHPRPWRHRRNGRPRRGDVRGPHRRGRTGARRSSASRRIRTRAGLLASMPGGAPGQRLRAIDGNVPILGELPPGCAFNPRCPDRFEPCTTAPPPDYPVGADHERSATCTIQSSQSAVARVGSRSRQSSSMTRSLKCRIW